MALPVIVTKRRFLLKGACSTTKALQLFNYSHFHSIVARNTPTVACAGASTSTCSQITPKDVFTFPSYSKRWLSSGGGGGSSAAAKGGRDGEAQIKSILGKSFPAAQNIMVEDISGGCGSMYKVYVESKEFEGLSIIKQHQLVNQALKDEIKDMHGIRIQTQIPR